MKLSKTFLLCSSLFAPLRIYIILFPLLLLNIFPSFSISKEYIRYAFICFIALAFGFIFGNSINFGMYSNVAIFKFFSEYISIGRFFFLIVVFNNALKFFYKDSYKNIFNRIDKFFTLFLVLNSIAIFIFILFPQFGDIIETFYNFGNEDVILTGRFRSQGLVVGFEYSAFACITLSLLGLIKSNKFYFLLGIFSSLATGRFGIVISVFLILITIFNISKKIIFNLFFNNKISKKQVSNISLALISIIAFLYLLYLLLNSIVGQSLSIYDSLQIFISGAFLLENSSTQVSVYDKLGYANYDVLSSLFGSRLELIQLLFGSGDSSIYYSKVDSGWFRLLAKGGIIFLFSILLTFYTLLKSLFRFSEKLIEEKHLVKSLNFYIILYTAIFFLLNSKSLAITSFFSLDIYLITLLIMVNNFSNFKNLEIIRRRI